MGAIFIKEARKMKEIDKLASRIKELQKINSPFMVGMIVPEKGRYKFSYDIRQGEKVIDNGAKKFDTRELVNLQCKKLVDEYRRPDDRSVIINIVSPRGGADG